MLIVGWGTYVFGRLKVKDHKAEAYGVRLRATYFIAKNGKFCHEAEVISVSLLGVYNVCALPRFDPVLPVLSA